MLLSWKDTFEVVSTFKADGSTCPNWVIELLSKVISTENTEKFAVNINASSTCFGNLLKIVPSTVLAVQPLN